jgi:hypothetical protein
VIDERNSQLEKQDEPRTSTRGGISIDSSDEDENADDSMRINREFDSNVIDDGESQSEKQNEPRISTLFGISTVDDVEKFRINL